MSKLKELIKYNEAEAKKLKEEIDDLTDEIEKYKNELDTKEKDYEHKTSELDYLESLSAIYNSGDCNACAIQNTCAHCPRPGELVRYNCFNYSEKI